MGLFGKLFEKKICSVCGGEIGLLGNRKLDDGDLCKNCAAKLSPFFSERRHSTVDQIREQLDYREANREAVADFHTTRSFGKKTKILIDEDARKFMVTDSRDLAEANPDVIACSDITNCLLDIKESRSEIKYRDKDGKNVSYNPPRYDYKYEFYISIDVNHPYFDEIRFKLNSSTVHVRTGGTGGNLVNGGGLGDILNMAGAVLMSGFDPREMSPEYRGYVDMGNEIVTTLFNLRQES